MDGQAEDGQKAESQQYDVADLMGGSDCQDALQTLYNYLDGELTPARRHAIQDHLSHCSPCLQAFDFEAELKSLVARSCRDQVPDALRRRIADALASSEPSETADPYV